MRTSPNAPSGARSLPKPHQDHRDADAEPLPQAHDRRLGTNLRLPPAMNTGEPRPSDAATVREDAVAPPLVVDVDGTLVGGDLLIEGAARLIAASPLALLALPFWLAGGRAALKRRIASRVALPPPTLVLNPAVLEEIAAARAAGREVWLASASDELAVAPLAEAVGAAGCLASDGRTNLAGQAKAAALVEHFGEGGFDYIGNERRDLAVWKHARHAIGVNLPARLARAVRALDENARFLPGTGGDPLDCFRALRPHQWVKNTLVFVPLVAAHETEAGLYLVAAGMFAALSACASGSYLFNDLLDLPHDRGHAGKRHRPFAAGKAPLLPMTVLGAALVAGGLALAFRLSAEAGFCVSLYVIAALAYSLSLKQKLFVDVLTLGTLYMFRVIAGGVAVSVALSPSFLAFFMFMFVALAVAKRQGELHGLHESGRAVIVGRAYLTSDLSVMTALGAASAFASVVVFAMYIRGPEVTGRYARPEFLWLICLLLIYWLGRLTLLANRGAVGDDPMVFTMRDRASWLTGVGVLAAFVAAL